MTVTVKLEGFADLEKELERLGKTATQKASLRRALKKSAQPLADIAQGMAPVGDTRTLAPSITVGTKLSKRQRAMHRKMFLNDRAAVEMFVGAGPLSSAHAQEFGNINHGPQAFMRPAWDQDKMALLDRLKVEIWADIQRSLKRQAARAARG